MESAGDWSSSGWMVNMNKSDMAMAAGGGWRKGDRCKDGSEHEAGRAGASGEG